jgi:putative mRNA 3-end processing factor
MSSATLVPSGHILGASQVQVELECGQQVGYSGDFQWPIDQVIKCDTLVLDSTHGDPRYKRRYSQQEVEERLLELLVRKSRQGVIFVRGHTGALQRVLTMIAGQMEGPFAASRLTIGECNVYARHGYPVRGLIDLASAAGRELLNGGRGIVLLRMQERPPAIPAIPIKIMLSGYISDPKEPVLEFDARDFRVALSDHADFEGILEYVRATGARTVITDNSRGGHGVDLARELVNRLGVCATPSGDIASNEWGRA